ncbi:MAG: hypothetical protein DIU78_007185 [Pseudomonadota bacterium]
MWKWLLLCLVTLIGCLPHGGVRVEPIAIAARKPGVVSTYLSVTEGGKPVTGLTAESFVLHEDEAPLSPAQTRQVLLDPSRIAADHVLLLADYSLATDKEVRAELASAIGIFVEKVRPRQRVTVYAFDGSKDISLVADFARAESTTHEELAVLRRMKPTDTSRNLYGAVRLALEALDELLKEHDALVRRGTLVVFSGGSDLAGFSDAAAVRRAIEKHGHTVLAIGIGPDAEDIADIGVNGYVNAHSAETLSLAFEDAAHGVIAAQAARYLLAYCTPARAGRRTLRIEVVLPPEEEGAGERRGEAVVEFDARNFGADCDPKQAVRYRTTDLVRK